MRSLIRGAQSLGIAVLLEDELDLALELAADGLHASDAEAPLAELRRALGPERSLGAACGLSRHLAIEAAEAEVDYVSFAGEAGALLEIVGWWAEVMTPPVVAEGATTPAEAAALAEAGADFVALAFELPKDARDLASPLAFATALGDGIRAEA
jgi:thiamine-phosphate pyrophosphorylase